MAETIGTVTSKVCAAGKVVVKRMEARTWDKENEISKKDIDELLEKVMSFAKVKDEFLIKMSTWKKTRQGTIDQLNYIVNECDSLHKGCNIANVTGSSVGATGGLMALGGLVLAPFTFGTSLSLTVAGGVVGAAGAATNITTSIVESSKMKGYISAIFIRPKLRKSTLVLSRTSKLFKNAIFCDVCIFGSRDYAGSFDFFLNVF